MSFETNLSFSSENQSVQRGKAFQGKVPEKDVKHLFFEHGIIGFGNCQEYALSPSPKQELDPLHVLVHARDPNILFFLVRFEDVNESLSPSLREEVSKKIGLSPQHMEGYYLVTSDGSYPNQLTFSINKRAPLFVDPVHQKGGQYVLKNHDLPVVFVLSTLSDNIRERLKAR